MGIPVSAPQMMNFPRCRDAGKRQIIEPKILQRLNRTASVRIKKINIVTEFLCFTGSFV